MKSLLMLSIWKWYRFTPLTFHWERQEQVHLEENIGQGRLSTIYRGVQSGSTDVAVKKTPKESARKAQHAIWVVKVMNETKLSNDIFTVSASSQYRAVSVSQDRHQWRYLDHFRADGVQSTASTPRGHSPAFLSTLQHVRSHLQWYLLSTADIVEQNAADSEGSVLLRICWDHSYGDSGQKRTDQGWFG